VHADQLRPSQVCIGVSPRRHSHGRIEETGEFVINVLSIGIEKATHFCGVNLGRDVDKFRETGLTPTLSKKLTPPRTKECFGHIE
jgi:flavin reductase (DIM6/NTAB) family NADH-FMN oxidoreductase RutF